MVSGLRHVQIVKNQKMLVVRKIQRKRKVLVIVVRKKIRKKSVENLAKIVVGEKKRRSKEREL
jgi:hypothetical protein